MDRRLFVLGSPLVALGCGVSRGPEAPPATPAPALAPPLTSTAAATPGQRRVAITLDDPHLEPTPFFSAEERHQRILGHLAARRVQAMVFVCGKRVDVPGGKALLSTFNAAGHLLANHTYTHWNYGDPGNAAEQLEQDLVRCEALCTPYSGFRRRLRFPYLKEGETAEKRDAMRAILKAHGYQNAPVTIDTSDWAYDRRLKERLAADPALDLAPFRAAYVAHVVDRAHYYDALATQLTGRLVAHTLLLHNLLINALFLGDVIDALVQAGFGLTEPETAYADPLFALEPSALPAGESLVLALAKGEPALEAGLRYPGEDAAYEADALNKL